MKSKTQRDKQPQSSRIAQQNKPDHKADRAKSERDHIKTDKMPLLDTSEGGTKR